MNLSIARAFLICAGLVVLSAGCQNGGPSAKVFVKNGNGQSLRIAVLPFENVSRNADAGRIVTNTVITYLLSTGEFDVVEPGVVYALMASEGVRLTEGITPDICGKLRSELRADAFLIGLVEDFGEVRVGSDTYPSMSFSARLVDARSASILWAATISKTGADSVKLFDIGRVSSLHKLSKQAVEGMARSLSVSREAILVALKSSAASPTETTASAEHGANSEKPSVTSGLTLVSNEAANTATKTGKSADETATYGQAELSALIVEVAGAKPDPVTYKKHFHDQVETRYPINGGTGFADVKLTDYRKASISQNFLKHNQPDGQALTFESFPAVESPTQFGSYMLDVAVGRFGLSVRGPKERKEDVSALARGIVASLK